MVITPKLWRGTGEETVLKDHTKQEKLEFALLRQLFLLQGSISLLAPVRSLLLLRTLAVASEARHAFAKIKNQGRPSEMGKGRGRQRCIN